MKQNDEGYKKYFPDDDNSYEDIFVDEKERSVIIKTIRKTQAIAEPFITFELSSPCWENSTTGAKYISGTLTLKKTEMNLKYVDLEFEGILHKKLFILLKAERKIRYDYAQVFSNEEIAKIDSSLMNKIIEVSKFGAPDEIVWVFILPELGHDIPDNFVRRKGIRTDAVCHAFQDLAEKLKTADIDDYIFYQTEYGCCSLAKIKISKIKNLVSKSLLYLNLYGPQIYYSFDSTINAKNNLQEVEKKLVSYGFSFNWQESENREDISALFAKKFSIFNKKIGISILKLFRGRFILEGNVDGLPSESTILSLILNPVEYYAGLELPVRKIPEKEYEEMCSLAREFLATSLPKIGINIDSDKLFKQSEKGDGNIKIFKENIKVNIPTLSEDQMKGWGSSSEDIQRQFVGKGIGVLIEEPYLAITDLFSGNYFVAMVSENRIIATVSGSITEEEARKALKSWLSNFCYIGKDEFAMKKYIAKFAGEGFVYYKDATVRRLGKTAIHPDIMDPGLYDECLALRLEFFRESLREALNSRLWFNETNVGSLFYHYDFDMVIEKNFFSKINRPPLYFIILFLPIVYAVKVYKYLKKRVVRP